MRPRSLARLLVPPLILYLAACARGPAARHFAPASAADAGEALSAWRDARERAAALPPSRLLYDAHMGSSGLPSVPGTLAVTYDGRRIEAASLTGPFGSHVAEYRDGAVTGENKRAFVVDPDALRSVLAGVWTGEPAAVAGRDGDDYLLVWETPPYRVEAVLDARERRVRSSVLSGPQGRLEIAYSGSVDPWPERVALRDAKSGRGLSLARVAVEPLSGLRPPA